MCDCGTSCGCDNSSILPVGPTGADGSNGLSAYEIAVANGFGGTEAEWLASLIATVFFEIGTGTDSLQTKDNGADASGVNSLAIGLYSGAHDLDAIAIGHSARADNEADIAIGRNSVANGHAIAIGDGATADQLNSIALGTGALANIEDTTQIQGGIITKKDSGEGDPHLNFAGAIVTLTTEEIDLTASGIGFTIDIPTGAKFYPNEVSLVITNANNVTVQPFIRLGITGTVAKLLAITATTGLTATYDRQRFTTLLSSAGESSLRAEVTTAATATIMKGRFVFTGLLIESE